MGTRSLLRYSLAALAMVAATAAFPTPVMPSLSISHRTTARAVVVPRRLALSDITQVGANVHFVVNLANGVSWAQTGAADFQLFKFNATGVVLGDISVVQTFAGQTLQANTGTLNGDGTGNFSFGIGCSTCGNGALGISSNLDFTIAMATIADVTAPNNLGNIFVADVQAQLAIPGRWMSMSMPCPARLSEPASRV